ncbi:hypothetical protein PIB30_023381 [Stylosanthes scabra]|uniref:Aminotransferase-like plant mobile domain-containing protein n=1 Tax=Stylosanthes scabra TaxID=79078 RepID=A0ABU6V7M2_9FABA|nr:hypothetical protein [Stylosanthes scabra]
MWHGLWDSRHDHTFTVEEVQHPGPSADYFRRWFLAGKRYLAPADPFFLRPRMRFLPRHLIELLTRRIHIGLMMRLTTGVQTGVAWLARGPPLEIGSGSMRCWGMMFLRLAMLDECLRGAIVEEADEEVEQVAIQILLMVGRAAAKPISPRFQRTLQQIFTGDTVYRPYVDGSNGQVQVDLNKPASRPSQMFMTYAGTPPSAYMPEPYVVASEISPVPAPDDPAAHDRDGDEGAVPMGRGRRLWTLSGHSSSGCDQPACKDHNVRACSGRPDPCSS